jgi:hypothetical protein
MPTLRSAAIAVVLVAGLSGSGCAQSGSRVDTPATDRATTGSIAGHIQHPAHAIPPMRICAIGSGAPTEATRICVRTQRAQGSYRIDGLPADDYVVIAETSDGTTLYRVGGHMQQVQCIRAPCPEMPKSVTVTPGATVDGIDLNGFYDRRDDFPALTPE